MLRKGLASLQESLTSLLQLARRLVESGNFSRHGFCGALWEHQVPEGLRGGARPPVPSCSQGAELGTVRKISRVNT